VRVLRRPIETATLFGRSDYTDSWIVCVNAARLVDLLLGRLDGLSTYSTVVDLNQCNKV